MGRRGRGGGVSLGVGIDSPAILVAILHGIMLLFYTLASFAEPRSIYIFLMLFGAIRVATFGMQTVAQVPGTANGITSAAAALWELGFFALLYSAYTLVLDRGVSSGIFAKRAITQIIRNVIRLLLAVAVVVGIPAWVYYTQAADILDSAFADFHPSLDFQDVFDDADSLDKKASVFQEVTVYTFLVVTALLAVQTLILLSWERTRLERLPVNEQPTGTETPAPYAMYMPSLIAIALLTRSIYRAVAINETALAESKVAFYLLGALPEWLAILFFASNGVVPKKTEVVPPTPEREKAFVVA